MEVDQIVGIDVVRGYGGEARIIDHKYGYISTTKILDNIKSEE